MPPVKRELIEIADYGLVVLDKVKNGLSPAAIATELKNDPVFMDRIGKSGYTAVFPTDIHNFLAKQAIMAMTVVEGVKGDAAAVALQAAKERIISTLQLGSEWEALARRGVAILTKDLDTYELEREAAEQYNSTVPPDGKKRDLPQFPHDTFTTTRKSIVTCVQIIQAIRGDHALQGIIKANTVKIQNGLTQDEVHDLLFAFGEELGLTRSKTLEVYTKALVKLKEKRKRGEPINADFTPSPGEGKWEGRLPFVKAVEKSSGLFPGDAPVKA